MGVRGQPQIDPALGILTVEEFKQQAQQEVELQLGV